MHVIQNLRGARKKDICSANAQKSLNIFFVLSVSLLPSSTSVHSSSSSFSSRLLTVKSLRYHFVSFVRLSADLNALFTSYAKQTANSKRTSECSSDNKNRWRCVFAVLWVLKVMSQPTEATTGMQNFMLHSCRFPIAAKVFRTCISACTTFLAVCTCNLNFETKELRAGNLLEQFQWQEALKSKALTNANTCSGFYFA